MELDLSKVDAATCYRVLSGLIVPRPIAWVSTVDEAGVVNLAPFSFFNLFGDEPPVVVVAPGDRPDGSPKDTAANIRRSGEFVVNLVDEAMIESANATAAPLPPGESELSRVDLTTATSVRVAPPRIADAPASLECREHTTLMIGTNRLVVGIVLYAHIRDELLAAGDRPAIDPQKYRPVGRMQGPGWFCRTRDLFSLERPTR